MPAIDNLRNQFNSARATITTHSQAMRTELSQIRKQQSFGLGLNLGIGKFKILQSDDSTTDEDGGYFAQFRSRIEEARANLQAKIAERTGGDTTTSSYGRTYQPRPPARDITLQPKPPKRGITLS